MAINVIRAGRLGKTTKSSSVLHCWEIGGGGKAIGDGAVVLKSVVVEKGTGVGEMEVLKGDGAILIEREYWEWEIWTRMV
jgi:hypothetical protein